MRSSKKVVPCKHVRKMLRDIRCPKSDAKLYQPKCWDCARQKA